MSTGLKLVIVFQLSAFFSKCGSKSKWYYSCALFKMCLAKDNNIDVLWCFSGQLFPSCEIQSPGSHQRDAMTIVARIIISIIKLTHQASSSLSRFPACLQKSPGSGSWEPDFIITIIKPFQVLASPASNYINRNAIHHHSY